MEMFSGVRCFSNVLITRSRYGDGTLCAMKASAPSSRTETIFFAANGWFGATTKANSSTAIAMDLMAWSVGLKETTPISTSRPRISPGIRLARLRFTSILMCGCRARKVGIKGSRHITVYSLAPSAKLTSRTAENVDRLNIPPTRKSLHSAATSSTGAPAAVSASAASDGAAIACVAAVRMQAAV